ncbi:hypothetical protein PIB30_046764 [Stylosanthes scabra]|uniref:Uncharacterized protein n=1 Tax=Stylosanthes scabra TaxID=79078 RepID=A0ABU6WEL6_9FABA|nr:hypothetical protein [Stylosanthes scabra]
MIKIGNVALEGFATEVKNVVDAKFIRADPSERCSGWGSALFPIVAKSEKKHISLFFFIFLFTVISFIVIVSSSPSSSLSSFTTTLLLITDGHYQRLQRRDEVSTDKPSVTE